MKRSTIIFTVVAISLAFFYQTTFAGNEKGHDLNGDWDAFYDSGGYGTYEDVVRITQKDNQFVGIYLIKGDNLVGKNEEKIKGKIIGNVIDEIFFNDIKDGATMGLHWAPSQAEISQDGNAIMIKRLWIEKGATTTRTLSLKRK